MTLVTPGWFQDTWFCDSWWQQDWWLEYGTAAPVSPYPPMTIWPVEASPKKKRKLRLLRVIKHYLELKQGVSSGSGS